MIGLYENKNIKGISSSFFIDDKTACCGRPWLYLCHWKGTNNVALAVHDMDDLDFGYIYKCKDIDETEKVFKEISNFLYDISDKMLSADRIYDGSLLPIFLDVKREHW